VINFISTDTGKTVNIDGQDVPIIQRGPANIASENRYGFEFNLTYSPSRKWRINTDFNLFNSIVNGSYENTSFDSKNVSWSVRMNNKLTLPGNIDWQTNLNYRGPSKDAQNVRDGVLTGSIAFSKDLLKEKASVAFNISDLFNSQGFKGIIETEDFITNRDIQFRGGRTFNVSFTYRFNQKKKPQYGGNYGGGGDVQM
jgi:hypothetical protein